MNMVYFLSNAGLRLIRNAVSQSAQTDRALGWPAAGYRPADFTSPVRALLRGENPPAVVPFPGRMASAPLAHRHVIISSCR
jgi:hypothetical protein